MRKTLEVIENLQEEVDLKKCREYDLARSDKINMPQRTAELYQLLVLKTEGEAKLTVKSVPDSDGIRAWQKLHRHYHRRTFAKAT